MPETKLRKKEQSGHSIDVVVEVIADTLRQFSQRKFTGRILPEIDFSQGTISDFTMGQKARVKRKE